MAMTSEFDLAGRRVLLTGGSRGLGRAMGYGLVGAGASVVSVARGSEECSEGELH